MGLESVTKVTDLNVLWPLSTDPRTQGDDHLRAIKVALKSLLTDMSQVDSRHVDLEIPGGVTVGSTTLTLAHTPNPVGSLMLFKEDETEAFAYTGCVLLINNLHYTISGSTITLSDALVERNFTIGGVPTFRLQNVLASYRW